MQKVFLTIFAVVFLAASCSKQSLPSQNEGSDQKGDISIQKETSSKKTLDFSQTSPLFRFGGEIPENLQVEFVPKAESINIFDPALAGESNLEKSKIFVRYFRADRFLTLSTVNVLSREETSINGRAAVRYEIEKKPGAANFPNQPSWRSRKHKLIDIRLEPAGTTYFYVFSYSPDFPEEDFESFLQSLKFKNSSPPVSKGLSQPISKALERITKKPFGIKVSPENSPVSPERFSGFHNAVDFEILPGEETKEVMVNTICQGELLVKRTASGYGGLAVQKCEIEEMPVTVVYGHLKLSSIQSKVGDVLKSGDELGVLGEGFSKETDFERKHLHLGIHKGENIDIRGYVQTEKELSEWMDFRKLLGE